MSGARRPLTAWLLSGACLVATLVAATGGPAAARPVSSLAASAVPASAVPAGGFSPYRAPALAAKAAVMAASPGGQKFSVKSGTLNVLDGPTGNHAVTLAYNLYVPDGATAAAPAPAILSTNGFGLDKDANELTGIDSFFASHGYVALAWTAQGFGTSGGCIQLDSSQYDVKDASAFVDLLQTMPFVAKDAKGAEVGMVGGSYGGAVDLTTAENDPRIRAIAPSRTWNALIYSLDPNNVVSPGETAFTHPNDVAGIFKVEWTTLFTALGLAQPVGGIPPTGSMNGGCAADKIASMDPATLAGAPCTGYYLAVCKAFADSTAGIVDADDEAALALGAPATSIDKLTVPTLFTQGQSDTLFNENEAYASYSVLKARGVPVGWLWNDGGHGGYNSQPGEGEEYDGVARTPAQMDSMTIPLAQLSWMDRYLRGNAGVAVPQFAWFRDYVTDAATPTGASAYESAPSFPVMASTSYALSGAGALATSAAAAGSATILSPPGGAPASYSETSNEQAPANPATGQPAGATAGITASDPTGEVATFDTPAFTVDEESVGIPTAHLVIAHADPAGPLQFFAKVYDVAPDGSKTLIRRLVAPVSVASPGTSVDVHLAGFAHEFAAGHRAELAIASTDMAYKGSGLADVLTVTTGPGTSTFSLPLRPLTAGAPAVVAAPVATAASAASASPAAAKAPAASKPARVRRPAAPTTARKPVASGRTLAYTGLDRWLPTVGLLLLLALLTGAAARSRRRHHS